MFCSHFCLVLFWFLFVLRLYIEIFYYETCLEAEKMVEKMWEISRKIVFSKHNCGAKGPGWPDLFQISSPRSTPKSKKWPRTDGESPGLQIVRPKTVVSSAGHKHRRERCHVTQGGPPEDREGDFKPYGLAIEGWWRDNPWRSHYLRIKYTQLTLWLYWCGCDPWTAWWGPQLLTQRQKEWLRGRALEDRSGWLTSVGGEWTKERNK